MTNTKLNGYQTLKPKINLIYHSKTNSFYEIDSVKKSKKKGTILIVKYLNNNKWCFKKFNFEECTLLNSTRYKDCFGNEIFENSLVRDIEHDEYGVVKFGMYSEPTSEAIIQEGFYIEWDIPSLKLKDFNVWINEGIQLVDLLDRRNLSNET